MWAGNDDQEDDDYQKGNNDQEVNDDQEGNDDQMMTKKAMMIKRTNDDQDGDVIMWAGSAGREECWVQLPLH